MSDEIIRVCKVLCKVHGELTEDLVYRRGRYGKCKKCVCSYSQKWSLENRERATYNNKRWVEKKKKDVKWDAENKEKVAQLSAKWIKNNRERHLANLRKCYGKSVKEMRDGYMIKLIKNKIGSIKDIDKDILQLAIFFKRDKITFDRKLKQLTGDK